MLKKLWTVSTRKTLIKPDVFLNRNGLDSCSWNIWCCRWVMWFVSQLLLLNQHIQANLSAVFLLKWQSPFSANNESRKMFSEMRYFTNMWSLFVWIIPLVQNSWLTDGLSSLQGSCFFQTNNGSAAKMPHVLIHGRGWKFCGAVRCEQRNHGGRTGSKCGCSAGSRELWIKELLSFSKLC